MSSRYLNQMSGLYVTLVITCCSHSAMKMFATEGANLLPIAVPLIWRVVLFIEVEVISGKTNFQKLE